ncbi:MAG: hypothetical protein QXW35_05240 [Candidatus Aenigmatarchaeota archaeon]
MFIVEVDLIYDENFVKSLIQEMPTISEYNLFLFDDDQISISMDRGIVSSSGSTFTDVHSLCNYIENLNVDTFTIALGYDDITEAVDLVKKIENKYSENILSIRIIYIVHKTIYEKNFYDD